MSVLWLLEVRIKVVERLGFRSGGSNGNFDFGDGCGGGQSWGLKGWRNGDVLVEQVLMDIV